MSSQVDATMSSPNMPRRQLTSAAMGLLWAALRVVLPVLLALVVSGLALLLLGKDPLANIKNVRTIETVWIAGNKAN